MSPCQYRFLLGLPRGDRQVFLSWRLLASDAPDTPFHVERQDSGTWTRVTTEPVIDATNYLHSAPAPGVQTYRVVTADGAPSEAVTVDAGAPASLLALDRPLDPEDRVEGIIVGDLENDGRLGTVLRTARRETIWLCAYGHKGQALWKVDTRLPARGGWDGSTLHVPFLCWDINGDGRSEVLFPRFPDAYPTDTYDTAAPGEELAAVDAATGEIVWAVPWPAVQSRVMMTVAHLRGLDQPASIVVQDETYCDVTLTAIDACGEVAWRVHQARPGGHNLDAADLDGDGRQEVICGGVCYNGDGTVRWEAEPFGHTDISKPAKIDPNREGLQIWYAVESGSPGVYLVDKEGKTLFKEAFRHAHYGWIARHAPGIPGLHPHTAEDARHEYGAASAGKREAGHFPIFLPGGAHWLNLTDWQRKNFVPVHWDAGPEVVFILRKENKRIVRLLATGEIEELPESKLPEGGEYGRNLACVDVMGDYRENIVTVDRERHRLIVLANPTPSHRRGYSPCDQFEYWHDRSQLGSGYYIYLSPPDTTVLS
jgi:rhamnogalacturonan endolyase